MPTAGRSVLLVEEGWHATMDLARGLERAGFAVTVLTANGSIASCVRRSVRWISGPAIHDARLVDHLDQQMTATPFDHVVPLTEHAMGRLWDAAPAWQARVFPPTEAWQRRLLRDKHALVEHMAARGIDVPAQTRLSARGDAELSPPRVIKGAIGSGGRMVRIAETPAELADAIYRAETLGGEWVAQELVPGPTFLFGGVFDGGRPLRIYAGEKLELYPPRTGGAIRIRSLADPALVELGLRVLRELAWTGYASADFMRRVDGRYVLLEVNPRLWGSLAGAREAGVELFAPFAELLAGGHPAPDLAFAADRESMIFPRYLNAASHRTLAGARQALRDLRGEQGREWLAPAFALHLVRRLRRMKQQMPRL